jgi:hypothetical protein
MLPAVPWGEARVSRRGAEVEFVAIDGADRPAALKSGELHHGGPCPESTIERRRRWTSSRRSLPGS